MESENISETLCQKQNKIRIFYAPLQLHRRKHREYLIFHIQNKSTKENGKEMR